jgi:hypothetical protein
MWIWLREFGLNVLANIAAAAASPTEMIGYAVAFTFGLAWLFNWHRKRHAEGKRGVDSWYFIALAFAVAISAVAVGAYGVGLRSAPARTAVEHLKEIVATHIDLGSAAAPENKSVLVASRYYSAKNKEDVAGVLDKISDVLNKEGDQTLQLAEIAINKSPWDRPGEDILPFIKRMEDIANLTVKMHIALYDEIVDKEREYRIEVNSILFPKETFTQFQITANEFRNGLSVWMKTRDAVDPSERHNLLMLVMASRMAFGQARDKFVAWLSQRQELIGQTRRALRA